MACGTSTTASAPVSLRMLTLSAGRPSDRAMVVASTDWTSTSASVPSFTGPSGAGIGQLADLLGAGRSSSPTWMASSMFPS